MNRLNQATKTYTRAYNMVLDDLATMIEATSSIFAEILPMIRAHSEDFTPYQIQLLIDKLCDRTHSAVSYYERVATLKAAGGIGEK